MNLPENFFAKNQYINSRGGYSRKVTTEESNAWDRELIENRLSKEDFLILLELPYWPLAYAPFFLAGLRIFHIYYYWQDGEGDDPIEPRPGNQVIGIFSAILSTIRSSELFTEESNDSINIGINKLLGGTKQIFLQDMLSNANKYEIKIKPSRLIAWAIDRHFELPVQLLNALNVFQRPLVRNIETFEDYQIEHVKSPPSFRKAYQTELEILALSQCVWFNHPDFNRTQLVKHDLVEEYARHLEYTKTSKHLRSLVQKVDPKGKKRKSGRPCKNQKALSSKIVPIPDLFVDHKLHLEAAKIVFTQLFCTLSCAEDHKSISPMMLHPIFEVYLEKSHPIIREIAAQWYFEHLNY